MEYRLSDIHYEKLNYFHHDQHGINYNIFEESIIPEIFDHQLIIDFLNYIKFDNDIKYLINHKKKDILNIFGYFCLDEYYILKILLSDDFIKTIGNDLSEYNTIIKIKKYNQIFHVNLELSNKFFDFIDCLL
jgi:hypothetical protein